MSELEKSAEEVLEDVRRELIEWDGLEGHERCFYHPERLNRIAKIVNVKLNNQPKVPTPEQVKEGCERYWREQYSLRVIIVPQEYKPSS